MLAGAVAVGHGALAGPDLRRPSTWSGWASQRTPAEAAMAVLRLTVVVLALYLLVATVVAVVMGIPSKPVVETSFREGFWVSVPVLALMGLVLMLGVFIPPPLVSLLRDAAALLEPGR